MSRLEPAFKPIEKKPASRLEPVQGKNAISLVFCQFFAPTPRARGSHSPTGQAKGPATHSQYISIGRARAPSILIVGVPPIAPLYRTC